MTEKCPFCLGWKTRQVFCSALGASFRCLTCRGRFNSPRTETDTLYDQNYFLENYEGIADQQKEIFDRYLRAIKKRSGEGSLLDYGCGTGNFLLAAQDAGFRGNLGVDVSPAALSLARQRTGGRAELCLAGERTIRRRFRLISLVDSLAHLPEGRNIVSNLLEHNLEEGGMVFLRTPLFTEAYFAYAGALSSVMPAKYLQGLYFLPQRYLLFTRKALNHFLKSIGLEVCFVSEEAPFVRDCNVSGLRGKAKSLLFRKIPRILNRPGSIVLLARRSFNPQEKA